MSHISVTLLVALALLADLATAQNAAAGASQSTNSEHSAAASDAAGPGAPVRPVTPVPRPVEPVASGEPHTEMLPDQSAPDSLLDLKPLPRGNLSLIGGIARKVDVVHNRVTVQPFGGGNKYLIYFDERTRFLSSGRETTVLEIHPGDRVYVDTQTLGGRVFARTIQVRNKAAAQATGHGLK